ncbi:Non-structural maintenance of chromosomes element 3 homolog [Geodia barretti]|uniref:Non-structural maintenance of chromosomes element 3 homolog n=1 Tax=Geodia barretti TaxID=519541 RepID=A0AA35X9C3_GEOBA|nr:Non-structural maintenance of chromosomes element 3 homolog [Geodia barretti]
MSQAKRSGRGDGRGRKRSHSYTSNQEGVEEGEETSQTQDTHDERPSAGSSRARRVFNSLDKETVDRKVGEIVRYLLCAERRKAPVKKSELIDKAIGSEFSSCFSCFIPLAKERLSEVFGVDLEEVIPTKPNTKAKPAKQQTSVRYYILTNQIPAHAREALLPCSLKNSEEQGLLFFILALILLKDGSIQEESLFKVLRHVGITNGSIHSRFQDVDTLIRKDFVEAKFLDREKTVSGDQHRYLQWNSSLRTLYDVGTPL